jgi:hypothetical protein
MQFICADNESFPKAAVGVYAEYLKFLTAIAKTTPAGKALHIIHVRLDGAPIAWPDVADVRANLDHFYAQLVPGDPRVTKQRELAQVSTRIGAADADAVSADERFTLAQGRGFSDFESSESARRFELNGFHWMLE